MRTGFLIFILLMSSLSFAAKDDKASTTAAPAAKAKGGQAHDFEDLLVQGKYHFSDDVVTTVEEDKVLDSLIGVRSEFKDKIENSDSQF